MSWEAAPGAALSWMPVDPVVLGSSPLAARTAKARTSAAVLFILESSGTSGKQKKKSF